MVTEDVTLEQVRSDRAFAAWRQDAAPTARARKGETGDVLRPVDWASAGIPPEAIPQPKRPTVPPRPPEQVQGRYAAWPADAPLPAADVVVLTWTTAEWAALHEVFCEKKRNMTPAGVGEPWWRKDWLPYSRGYHEIHEYMEGVKRSYLGHSPSLYDKEWGQFRLVRIGDCDVLLVKSGMHLAQDGPKLPLRRFVKKILEEAEPKLVLSIGTAGAVRTQDALGTALITNQARFYLLGEFKDAAFNNQAFASEWEIPRRFVVAAQKLACPVIGLPILPVSPQYPDTSIEPDASDCRIEIVPDPIITTDTFLFGTTDNHLDEFGCIVEMDDAVIAMVCDESNAASGKHVKYAFVRNASDPVINARIGLPELQREWAAYIYKEKGLFTSYNGALGAWAVVAGWAKGAGSGS
jgi:nucleoside phosphorylase